MGIGMGQGLMLCPPKALAAAARTSALSSFRASEMASR